MRYRLNENKELVKVNEATPRQLTELAKKEFVSIMSKSFKPSQADSAPTKNIIETIFMDLIFLFKLKDLNDFAKKVESGEAKKVIMKWNRKNDTYPLNRADKLSILSFFDKAISRASFQINH